MVAQHSWNTLMIFTAEHLIAISVNDIHDDNQQHSLFHIRVATAGLEKKEFLVQST